LIIINAIFGNLILDFCASIFVLGAWQTKNQVQKTKNNYQTPAENKFRP